MKKKENIETQKRGDMRSAERAGVKNMKNEEKNVQESLTETSGKSSRRTFLGNFGKAGIAVAALGAVAPSVDAKSTVAAECGGAAVNNVTNERPNHSKAMVRVLVSGLSVFGFNPAAFRSRAEFGFIKEHHTPLKMEIYRNGCPNLYWTTDRESDFPRRSTDKIMITINSTESEMGKRYEGKGTVPNDEEDFRHMPSFKKWHGKRLDLRDSAKDNFSARLNVRDATFYTYLMSRSFTQRIPIRNGSDQLRIGEGPIGRVIGADIKSNDRVKIEIKGPDGFDFPITLPHEEGVQYTIVVTTRPQSHPEKDIQERHLGLIYNGVLKKPDDDEFQYEIRYVDNDELPWYYCVVGDKSSGLFYVDYKDWAAVKTEDIVPFDSIEKARKEGYKPGFVGPLSVQYVCECMDGSCGGLPPFP